MIAWNILLTDQAETDLRKIYEYIALTLLEPGTAVKLIRRIATQISKLNQMPNRHPLYLKEPWRSRGLRRVNAGNFSIFYVPLEDKQTVVVIRIIYAGRDIEQVLGGTPYI